MKVYKDYYNGKRQRRSGCVSFRADYSAEEGRLLTERADRVFPGLSKAKLVDSALRFYIDIHEEHSVDDGEVTQA